MSNSPTDQWMQFYQQAHNGLSSAASGGGATNVYGGDRITDATLVTTTSSTSPTGNNNNHQMTMSLSPESGRVTKPARKRSRASRRTPTTLLNTDKSNFRAMVQQFTGGPAFGSGSGSNNPNFMAAAAFGLGLAGAGGARGQAPATGGAVHMMGSGAGGYQLQYQQQQGQYHQQNRGGYSNMMYSGQVQDPSNPGGLIQRLMIGNPNSGGIMGMEGQGHGEGTAETARPAAGGANENTSYMF